MIQRAPLLSIIEFNEKTDKIWYVSHSTIQLADKLKELYNSTLQINRTLYGVGLYSDSKNQHLNLSQLSLKARSYICSCFWIFNWEAVNFNDLSRYMQALPESENEVEDVRVEGCFLKLTKFNKELALNLRDKSLSIEDCKYFLNTFDREGKSQMLEYSRSLKKIKINRVPYCFDGLINIVESCQAFVAVSTLNSIYIISIKQNCGKFSQFDVPNCIDIKWSERGLYFLQQSGLIGLLERQNTFKGMLNEFSMNYFLDCQPKLNKEFVSKRLLPVKNSLILLGLSTSSPRTFILQQVNSCRNGTNEMTSIQKHLKQVEGIVHYSNIILRKQEVVLTILSGKSKIEDYHEYVFRAS